MKVTSAVEKRPYSAGERAVMLVTRVLTAALSTAIVGAIENWFYERFFAPELYAAGPPLTRALFTVGFSLPFILAGLILLGLPTAYALHRLRAESALTYALAGGATGIAWGYLIGVLTTYGLAVSTFYGCTCALFWWWLRPRV